MQSLQVPTSRRLYMVTRGLNVRASFIMSELV
jgi:hypothetical protein